ncbi:DNA polymerase III subunit delta' [uncultured Sphingomonas sp.]|uniref:DNA polymerase III subunit delta' n=1 Tax=uncultured Sphingomonas sp. TaxID=158754 RepID=UPI0025FE2598|nr:DNA polymerase III subunit delta' [uncultured Sphingomonas sp.]
MTSLVGNDMARAAIEAADASGNLHHAWLITGAEGLGKASFAKYAAERLLARASGDHAGRTAAMIAAGAHPDFRVLDRLPVDADKPDKGTARSIRIDQVRALGPMLGVKPSMSDRRVIVIDAIDDLERPAANALLKSLEEPPAGTIFLLVSHAPGRLLPTIRSRCRLLRFDVLDEGNMRTILRDAVPQATEAELAALIRAGSGSPGRALRFAGLDLATIETALETIARDGDADTQQRGKLSKALSPKAAQPRYEAFLERVPAFIAERARTLTGEGLREALDAYAAAADLARASLAQSLDAATTTFEMGGYVARLARGR